MTKEVDDHFLILSADLVSMQQSVTVEETKEMTEVTDKWNRRNNAIVYNVLESRVTPFNEMVR